MLEFLRSKTGGIVAKLFIGLLAVSFAVWGIADIFRGGQGQALATVGEQTISEDEFRRAFEIQMRNVSQRFGRSISYGDPIAQGLRVQLRNSMIRDAALDEQARKLGLAASQQLVANAIQQNPQLQGPDGKVDGETLRRILAQNGISEAEFEADQRREILRAEVLGAVNTSLTVPETLQKAVWTYNNQRRGGRYFTIPGVELPADKTPSDSELKSYYDKNKRTFTAPEFRTLTVLRLQPTDIMEQIAIDETELKAAYERRADQYTIPERRAVEQITFLTEDDAKAAREKILAGSSFADVAKERGLTEKDYRLGLVTKNEMTDQALALAAFDLEKDKISEPIAGALATVLLRVTEIQPGQAQSFESLKGQLEKDLKTERAKEEILNIHDEVEDERAGGSTLAEISQKLNLPLIQIDGVDASGAGIDGKPVTSLPASQSVLSGAFESDVGVENDPIETSEDGFVWYDVTAVTPQTLKPFADVQDQVKALWTADEQRKLQEEAAKKLVERANTGTSLEALAVENGRTIATLPPTQRSGSAGGLGRSGLEVIFNTPKGKFAYAPSLDNQSLVIVETTSIEDPAYTPGSDTAKRVSQALQNGVAEDLQSQYLIDVSNEIGVSINQQIWRRFENPEQQQYPGS
ncbi:MAG: SurA N-terminal domain-containing protein [Hyphomicrobiales bacterium]